MWFEQLPVCSDFFSSDPASPLGSPEDRSYAVGVRELLQGGFGLTSAPKASEVRDWDRSRASFALETGSLSRGGSGEVRQTVPSKLRA